MSIYHVTINGNAYEVYGGLVASGIGDGVDPVTGGAIVYLAAAIGGGAVTWQGMGAGTVAQAQILVAMSRLIDLLPWQGVAVGLVGGVTATTLQWPRSGVVDMYGNAVDPTSVPLAIIKGTFEFCASSADDPDVQSAIDSGSNIKSVHGGPAGVDYFAPTSAARGTATVLPQIVQRYVGQYLNLATLPTCLDNGTYGCSEADHCRLDFLRSWPF